MAAPWGHQGLEMDRLTCVTVNWNRVWRGPGPSLCRAFLLTPCPSSAGIPGGRTASLHSSIQLWVFSSVLFFSFGFGFFGFFWLFFFSLLSSLYMFGVFFVCVCVPQRTKVK